MNLQVLAARIAKLDEPPEVRELMRAYLIATLEACRGDKIEAAERLGICLKTFYSHLNEIAQGGTYQLEGYPSRLIPSRNAG